MLIGRKAHIYVVRFVFEGIKFSGKTHLSLFLRGYCRQATALLGSFAAFYLDEVLDVVISRNDVDLTEFRLPIIGDNLVPTCRKIVSGDSLGFITDYFGRDLYSRVVL